MLSIEDLFGSTVRAPKLNKQVAVCDCNKGKPIDCTKPLVQFVTKVDKEGYCVYCKHYAVLKEVFTISQAPVRKKKKVLTEQQIAAVKSMLANGISCYEIGRQFQVGQSTIWRMGQKLKENKNDRK